MLHNNIDTIISDLSTVSLKKTLKAISYLYETDFLHQVTRIIQLKIKIERKRLKPLEDVILAQCDESLTRDKLHDYLLARVDNNAIKKLFTYFKRDIQNDQECQINKLAEFTIEYNQTAKTYLKLIWLHANLSAIIEKKYLAVIN